MLNLTKELTKIYLAALFKTSQSDDGEHFP